MKSSLHKLGGVWVSRTKETTPGTYQEANLMRLPWEPGMKFELSEDKQDDRDRITGKEGPTQTYELARTASGSLSQNVSMADFLTWIFAYYFGACANTAPGTLTKMHVITPLTSIDHPTFTAYQKLGDGVFSERFAGLGVNSFNVEIGSGWIKSSCDLKGWGKSQVDYIKATGTLTSTTTLTLAEYTAAMEGAGDGHLRYAGGTSTDLVAGSTSPERLENIHRVRIQKADGTWVVPTLTECTGPTGGPSVVTFSEIAGLVGTEAFEIYYISAQADTWKTPPSINQESPLKLVDCTLTVNGLYAGGTTITGGDTVINNTWGGLTISGDNGLQLFNMPGSGKIYASKLLRGQRVITFQLSDELRSAVLAADIDANSTLSLQINVEGAEIETGYKFGFRYIVPKVGIIGRTIDVQDKYNYQKGNLIALEDDTYGVGKFITWNKITTYISA